jgi:hypothetical protein
LSEARLWRLLGTMRACLSGELGLPRLALPRG